MFEKRKLKKICKSGIKKVFYMGVELWVPEDFYDRPVEFGSVLFHLESVKRGYQLHALAGSRATVRQGMSYDTYYANLTSSMLKMFGENPYLVKTRSQIERKGKTISTEVYQYDWHGNDMGVCYLWILFEKTQQYVLLYATGPLHTVRDNYEEFVAVADTIKC